MAALGILLVVAGLITAIYGNISFLIIAFRESALWGLGVLLVPFVALIYLVMRWQECWKPFVINLAGLAIFWGGLLALGAGQASEALADPDFDAPPPAEASQ